jgi:acyl carrier protein
MQIQQFVKAFVGALDDVKPSEVSLLTVFRDLPCWDSLAVLTVTDAIETDFGVLLSKADFDRAKTVQDLYEIAQSKKA